MKVLFSARGCPWDDQLANWILSATYLFLFLFSVHLLPFQAHQQEAGSKVDQLGGGTEHSTQNHWGFSVKTWLLNGCSEKLKWVLSRYPISLQGLSQELTFSGCTEAMLSSSISMSLGCLDGKEAGRSLGVTGASKDMQYTHTSCFLRWDGCWVTHRNQQNATLLRLSAFCTFVASPTANNQTSVPY